LKARLFTFTLGPGKRAVAQAIADDIAPTIASLPGCQGVTVFGEDSDGQFGIFVLWASEAEANAAAPIIRPKLDERLAGHVEAAPVARLYDVLSREA
jgi:hypothetical protein